MTALIIIVLVVVALGFLIWLGSRQDVKQKNEWAAGAKPEGIDWDVILSPELQACLPDKKIDAIKIYRQRTNAGLKESKDAIEYAIAHPERAPSHLSRSRSELSEPRKSKPEEAGIDWDLMLSDEMQALLPNRKIEAIKLYRERTGVGLKEAKDAVEEYIDNPSAVPAKIRRYDLVAQQSDGIRDLLREGKRDEARKTYQAFTGVDQFTANEAIDALEEEVRTEADRYDRMHEIDPHAVPPDDTYDEDEKRRPS